ncbi:cytochrome P450 4B1-like [Alligator sinensis]|uniref:Cytochrome P450 4B1-like n=1 Tax=Alligator sinensis TaxID=38654 RepID=A0A1U8D5Q6_ALLSI|nr:cytochrome P450 4B1-like [Alligator sinensis]
MNSLWPWMSGDVSQVFRLAAVLCLTYVFLKVAQLYRKKQEIHRVLKNFPGPPDHWLYGHVKMLHPEEELDNTESWAQKYPRCHPLWFGGFLAFLNINHPEYAKAIYSRADPKSYVPYVFALPWLGEGLLLTSGAKWFRQRKLLTPGFHYDVLKPYVNLMANSVRQMLDKWEQMATPGKSVEIFQPVSLMTLDTIMKCAFSHQGNCQTDSGSEYIRAIFDLSDMIYLRMRTPLHQNSLIYCFTSRGRRFRQACKIAHDHTDKVIEERKKALKDGLVLEEIQKKRHLDFLDILLSAKDENGNGLSNEELRAQVDTFMFEGHDTTASGISWLLYCMAIHPEHQQRCREEIQAILGDRETIQWEDLGKMTYTTMCIKESLRIYPPVVLVGRDLGAPVTFEDGQTLPKGFPVILSIYGLHRNPTVWDNPKVFDPSRFSPENSSGRHPYAFLPFAAGPRNCIGQQFAMNEMKVALALTLLRFELSADPSKPPIKLPLLILRSKNGIHLYLKKLS